MLEIIKFKSIEILCQTELWESIDSMSNVYMGDSLKLTVIDFNIDTRLGNNEHIKFMN